MTRLVETQIKKKEPVNVLHLAVLHRCGYATVGPTFIRFNEKEISLEWNKRQTKCGKRLDGSDHLHHFSCHACSGSPFRYLSYPFSITFQAKNMSFHRYLPSCREWNKKKTVTKRERNNIHAGTAGLSRGTYSLSLAMFLFLSLCLDFWTMHAFFGTFCCKRKIKQCSGMLAFHIIISFISTKYLLWTAVSVLDTVAATRWKIYVETVRMIPVDCERNNIFPFPAIASFAPLLPSQPS